MAIRRTNKRFFCLHIHIIKIVIIITGRYQVLTAATGTRISTNSPARACFISLSLTSKKYWAHSCMNWKDASNSSIGTIFTLKNFMPISRLMVLCVVCVLGSFARSSFSSATNRLRTDIKRDWARAPITSAYRSAIMWMLPAFGPVWVLERECYIVRWIFLQTTHFILLKNKILIPILLLREVIMLDPNQLFDW